MRGSIALLLALLWATTAGLAAQGPEIPAHPGMLRFPDPVFRLPEPRRHRLASGSVIFVAEDSALPLVDLTVALRVGSFLDPRDSPGLASLTGALMRRAGAGDRDADSFDERVDFLGARLDSTTGILRGGASLNATTWVLDEALELFFEMLSRPGFLAERVESARRTLLENLRRRNEDPLLLLEREWEWLLYGDDYFATRPLTPATLERLEPERLLAFHRRHWRPERMVFALSGDVREEEILKRLDRLMSAWPQAEGKAALAPAWPPPPSPHPVRPGLYLIERDLPQAKVMLGHRLPSGPPLEGRELAALLLLREILGGGGAISRIGARLRTAEGIAYRAEVRLDFEQPWPRELRVFFDAAHRNVARAVGLCKEEIQLLRVRPVHPRELQVAREAVRAALRQAFDTAEEVAGYFAEDELLGRSPDHWRERYRLVGEIGAEEIREAAVRYLRPEDLLFLVVGREIELGLGAPGRRGALERATGHAATRLPARDPLTLKPIGGAPADR